MTNQETRLKFLSAKVKQFYFWKWAITLNLIFYFLLFITQIILIYGFKFELLVPTSKNGNLFVWLIFIQSIAGAMSISATIYTVRLERKFFYLNTISMIFFIFNNIILGIYLNAVKLILLWFPIVFRYYRWSDKKSGGINKVPQKLKIQYFFLVIIGFIILSCGLSYLVKSFERFPILIGFTFIFSFGSALFQMYGYIEGFIFALVNSFTSIIMFWLTHSYTQVLTSVIYVITLTGSTLAWLSIYHETYGTFKYVKKDKTLLLVNSIYNKY